MKNLYFVTFHPTNTQFVVEQDNEEKALESAIEANKLVGEMEDIDITGKKYYTVEPIKSFESLKIHLKRQDEYRLTKTGHQKCHNYISELKAKQKEILDAGLDTAEETFVDYTPEEIFADLLDFGIDEDGDIYNGYGVTDHYDADSPLGLRLGEDFVEAA